MVVKVLCFISLVFFLGCYDGDQSHFQKYQPFEDLFLAKHFPASTISVEAMEEALTIAQRDHNLGVRTQGSWVSQGPGNIGARITTLAIHPNNENIILAGFADGGLWRTVDGGQNWQAIFENEIVQSIGSIAFDPIDPSIIYVGTGDPDISGYPRIGGGIYKSIDNGISWSYIGLKETRITSKLIVQKSDPKIVYAATMGIPFAKSNQKGVYKSTDGGNNWKQILFVNDSTGISDMVAHPSDPNILYAISWNRIRNNKKSLVLGPDSKVFKTTNGGSSWTELSNGLPQGIFSRLGIGISESNPDVLYVSYTYLEDSISRRINLFGIYKTEDAGHSWQLHSSGDGNGLGGHELGGFGWYFGKIKVNPVNENDIFLLGVDFYRFDLISNSWHEAVDFEGTIPHADMHDLVFRNNKMYLATDGGLYKANVATNVEWHDIENIPTTQFYRTAYNPHFPNTYYGGAQDNGTCSGNGNEINDWQRIYGGDGFQMVFHPTDPDIFYVETQNGNIVVTEDGGNNFKSAGSGLQGSRHWDMQYIMSAHNSDVLYTGTDRIFKNTSGTNTSWVKNSDLLVDAAIPAYIHQITTLHESPIDKDILYCGTSDGLVWNTINGGQSWNKIVNGIPSRYVSSIKASPAVKNSVYLTQTGYKDGDFASHIYKSVNNGLDWFDIAGNLPPLAINDVLIYPNGFDNVLFVATDGGVYLTINGGTSWERLGNNLPFIPVFDMDYNYEKNEVIVASFARGIQTFELGQIGISLNVSTKITNKNDWSLYSTVVTSNIRIKNNNDRNQYTLQNSSGEIIKSFNEDETDVTNFASGMYFVIDNRGRSARFVKI